MEDLKQSYPLQWPVGYKRSTRRDRSRFKQSMGMAQYSLKEEVRKLGGSALIVSTNLQVRKDGNIYASDLDKLIPDPGVAVFFKFKGKEVSMCCDKYSRVWENMYALACGIEALRGMERWGVSEFLDRAFTGFAALPESTKKISWWLVLGFMDKPADWNWDSVEKAYKSLAKIKHPDTGGDTNSFQQLVQAFGEAKKHYGK